MVMRVRLSQVEPIRFILWETMVFETVHSDRE